MIIDTIRSIWVTPGIASNLMCSKFRFAGIVLPFRVLIPAPTLERPHTNGTKAPVCATFGGQEPPQISNFAIPMKHPTEMQ